jgi:prolyl-tRNA editing enzyme YbaK/EbsC (Cys-tRNA(Pro) deacylase)
MPSLSPTAQRVQDALIALGSNATIREHPEACRTSAEAAVVLGCTVGQIAKSVIFKGETSGQSILVVASGANRVDVEPGKVFFDQDLLDLDKVYPAGGTPQAMFAIAPRELLAISGATLADVRLASLNATAYKFTA